MYDYLVIGSGLYGSTFAQQAKAHGKSVLVIDKRDHIAGNVYTEKVEDINFHKYGAHIFHTNDKTVWDYLQAFTVFNRFTNSPVANYKGELYSMPFNMYTFNKKLTEKHRRDIRKICREAKGNIEFQSGCYLLLDQEKKAAECIDKLPTEKREAFLSYPIMRFMNSGSIRAKEGVGS